MLSTSSLSFSQPRFTSSSATPEKKDSCTFKSNLRSSSYHHKRVSDCHVPAPMHFSLSPSRLLVDAVPLAASLSILLYSNPVNAGILSGFSGLESVPGPQLPEIDFLKKWNDDNQKRYADLDSRFKSSPVLKDLLEKSRLNKEKNDREIQDKYCLRGAEWGVGDCSTQGMTDAEKDEFISMLKKKTGGD